MTNSSWDDSLFDNSLDALVILDRSNGQIIRANPTFYNLTGLCEQAGAPTSIHQLIPEQDFKKAHPFSAFVYQNPGLHEDVVIKSSEGHSIVTASVSHNVSAETPRSLIILRDITARKNLEREILIKHNELDRSFKQIADLQQQVIQAGKLAALGELAAGVSHELNQPLTGVRGFAQEILTHLKKSPTPNPTTLSFYADQVIKNTDRMTHIIRHLRSFARQGTGEIRPIPLAEVMDNALLLMGKQLANQGIEVQNYASKDSYLVIANGFELEQVLINLLANARDAITSKFGQQPGGRVELSAKYLTTDNCQITIRDNGIGMSPETLSRACDPFFTTKEVGKGMGLGLSISYGIIERFGGKIHLASTVGEGSTVTITLKASVVVRDNKEAA